MDNRSVPGFKKNFLLLWHRRAGKDKTALNILIREMLRKRGTYYYVFPEFGQGKRAIWEGIDNDGFRLLDHFPKGTLAGEPNSTELKIETVNGSFFQIIGASQIDTKVGANLMGVVYSEYAIQNPRAELFFSPILLANGGWAIFAYTPRSHNHGYKLWEMAGQFPDEWFRQKCTIDDTKLLTQRDMDMERAKGRSEEFIQQEYYASFESSLEGAYYSDVFNKAQTEGRFCDIPYDPAFPVHTVWDLGAGDSMAIGFYQVVGEWIHMIDYLEGGGKGFPYFAKVLQDRGYIYGKHFAPHDVKHIEIGTGKTRLESAREWGLYFEDVPNIGVQNGIDAGRMLFSKLKVDKKKCAEWLEIIPQYTKEYDEDKKIFSDKPLHNFASHGCFAGDTKVLTLQGEISIRDVKKGDMVETPLGLSKVLVSQYMGKKEVFDFGDMKVTTNHPFLTQRGFISLDMLRYDDILLLCQRKKNSSTKDSDSQDTQMQKEVPIGIIFNLLNRARQAERRDCTGMFGKTITGRFLKDIISIIKMVICLTIALITSKWLHQKNTRLTIRGFSLSSEREQSFTQSPPLQNGINQKWEESGTVRCLEKGGQKLKDKNVKKIVSSAARSIKRLFGSRIVPNSAILIANREPCGYEDTYNLKTENGMYIAGNFVVSNSDMFRYTALVFDRMKNWTQKRTSVYLPSWGGYNRR